MPKLNILSLVTLSVLASGLVSCSPDNSGSQPGGPEAPTTLAQEKEDLQKKEAPLMDDWEAPILSYGNDRGESEIVQTFSQKTGLNGSLVFNGRGNSTHEIIETEISYSCFETKGNAPKEDTTKWVKHQFGNTKTLKPDSTQAAKWTIPLKKVINLNTLLKGPYKKNLFCNYLIFAKNQIGSTIRYGLRDIELDVSDNSANFDLAPIYPDKNSAPLVRAHQLNELSPIGLQRNGGSVVLRCEHQVFQKTTTSTTRLALRDLVSSQQTKETFLHPIQECTLLIESNGILASSWSFYVDFGLRPLDITSTTPQPTLSGTTLSGFQYVISNPNRIPMQFTLPEWRSSIRPLVYRVDSCDSFTEGCRGPGINLPGIPRFPTWIFSRETLSEDREFSVPANMEILGREPHSLNGKPTWTIGPQESLTLNVTVPWGERTCLNNQNALLPRGPNPAQRSGHLLYIIGVRTSFSGSSIIDVLDPVSNQSGYLTQQIPNGAADSLSGMRNLQNVNRNVVPAAKLSLPVSGSTQYCQ